MRRSLTFFSFAALAIAVILNAHLAKGARQAADADSDSSADATPGAHHRKRKSTTPDADAATPRPKASPSPKRRTDDDDSDAKSGASDSPSPSTKKKSSVKGTKATPVPEDTDEKKPKASDSEPETPAPKKKPSTKGAKAAPAPDDSDDAKADTAPTKTKGKSTAKADATEPDQSPEKPHESEPKTYAPPAIIPASDLVGFDSQPEKVRTMIQAALDLTKLNLTYTYGSADPANGGMDCSGTIYYLLRQQGFTDVPRDASGQYIWARKNGQFYSVISRKAGGFEFSDLQPGDLLFWNGTYAIDRDPPVTHTMIYLGLQRGRKVPLMWGSSDGRSFDGKQRWGVSVFDFTMPRIDPANPAAQKAVFIGYARIPGLRGG